MRYIKRQWLSAAIIVAAAPLMMANAYYSTQQIGVIRGPDTRMCTFFVLVGVSVADPVVPNVPWFALPKSDPGYNDRMALLLSSKMAGKPISVGTDGTVSCGHATAVVIEIP